jgi:hypothetical protein
MNILTEIRGGCHDPAATSPASARTAGNAGDPATAQTLTECRDGRTWTVQKSPDAGGPSTSSHLNGWP